MDHPRSRGVYQFLNSADRTALGSSPLARGLPMLRIGSICSGRIIPARAGFTSPRWPDCASAWDHPRSRGVYRTPGTGRQKVLGSSPLARGLLSDRSFHGLGLRIIPARAGFTLHVRLEPGDHGDHPRSRGVYIAALVAGLVWFGSSPLARGLHGHLHGAAARGRIIPARAGFTLGGPLDSGSATDHPRSRGVYSVLCPTAAPK